MKDIRKYKYSIAAMFSLLLLVLSGGCSKDEGGEMLEPEAQYATMVISLGALDNSTPAYTKALDDNGYIDSDIIEDDFEDSDYEHYIQNYWLVVWHQKEDTYEFDRVLNDKNANNTDPDSKTQITLELKIGDTYKFFAFANLDGLKDAENLKNWLKDGEYNYEKFLKKEVELRTLTEYKPNDCYIPMSSYGYTVTVQQENNPLEIPLIRLLGKVELVVTNSSEKEVTIEELKMGKFRDAGAIYLLPYDANVGDDGKGNLLISKGNEEKLLNPSFPTPNEIEGNDWSLPEDADKNLSASADNEANKRIYSFYINETSNDNQAGNGSKDIMISMRVSGIEKDPAPKSTKFFFIRRNDLLQIPILISNAQTKLTISQQNMPIGGLPVQLFYDDGAIISDQAVNLDHSGIVSIGYTLESVNGNTTGWKLKYFEGEYKPGEQFCCAQVEENVRQEENKGLIYVDPKDTDDENPNLNIWTNLTWLGVDKLGFTLTPDVNSDGTTSSTSGSFKIRIQELVSGSAKVKLTLVATNGTSEVVLPYTITFNYGKGGN